MKSQKNLVAKQPHLSIVIPAYCEEKRIDSTLDTLSQFLDHDPFFKSKTVEVIVVVADSPDKTLDTVKMKKHLFKHFRLVRAGPKVGKGYDVREGMLRARGKFIMFMDADLATPLEHLEEFYKACQRGNEVVIGTRNLAKHHLNIIRRSISIFGNILFQIVGGMWIEDSQCGFKMFNECASQVCFSKMTIYGWSFDMEILTIAKTNSISIKTIRIDDWSDVPGGTFNENTLLIIFRSLRDLGYIAKNRLIGTYRH